MNNVCLEKGSVQLIVYKGMDRCIKCHSQLMREGQPVPEGEGLLLVAGHTVNLLLGRDEE